MGGSRDVIYKVMAVMQVTATKVMAVVVVRSHTLDTF